MNKSSPWTKSVLNIKVISSFKKNCTINFVSAVPENKVHKNSEVVKIKHPLKLFLVATKNEIDCVPGKPFKSYFSQIRSF